MRAMLRTQRARPAPSTDDRLSTLPDELKVLIVKQVGSLPSHYLKMDEFLAKEQFRLRAMQTLRALDSTFSRMPLTRSLLYDATSSVWAIQAAIRTTEGASLDLLDVFNVERPRKIEALLYFKEREAFFAIRDLGNTTLMKRYLQRQKRRRPRVDRHLEGLGIYQTAAAAAATEQAHTV